MAFVGSPFRHDIFVTYSHGDVQGDGQALLKQWSQGFVKQLERELQAFPDIGNQISVFLDTDHRPGQGIDPLAPLSDSLQQEIAHAAILAMLMSPQYLCSSWCRQEREWWLAGQREHELAHEDRIAVARVWPTGPLTWPEVLIDRAGSQYPGHFFFDRAKAEMRPQPYSWPKVSNETMGEFREVLLDYVGAIRARLQQIRNELEQRRAREAERQRLGADGGQVLYLHGRKTHSAAWWRVNGELESNNYVVFPMEPEKVESDPKQIKAARNKRVDIMCGCDAVLLLGADDDAALQADLAVIGRLDRQEAVARSNRLLPCGVVDTFGIVRQTPDWSRKAKKLGVDWFDASISPWTPQLQAWLHGAFP